MGNGLMWSDARWQQRSGEAGSGLSVCHNALCNERPLLGTSLTCTEFRGHDFLDLPAKAFTEAQSYTGLCVQANLVDGNHSQSVLATQVVLCKIPGSQFGNMYEAGQATYAHYAQEGLPEDPAGFSAPWQDRCFPLFR